MIKEGDEIPYHKFRVRHQYNMELAITFNDTLGEWGWINTNQVFAKKRIVLVGIPGAFTPTCGRIHIPRYEQNYRQIKSLGIDEIYCMSVNDSFVMNVWAETHEIENVKMIPDGSGEFTRDMDMLVWKPAQNFGYRSWRYAMTLNGMEVEKMWVEDGKNQMGLDSDPYEVTKPENILKNIP